jgi:hypothetical protein
MQNQMDAQKTQFEQQDFDNEMAGAMFQNQVRGQELDEAAFLRSQPFNEFTAMMNGTEVSSPNFSGPTVAPSVSGAPIYQAGQDSYQTQYNVWKSKMDQVAKMWETLGNTISGVIPG